MALFLASSILAIGSSVTSDAERLSEVWWSAFWFKCVLISGAIVAVGCAMELPETIVIFRRWRSAKKGTIIDDDPTDWRIPVAASGLLLVILGVAAETIFEALNSDSESAIRAYDERVIAGAVSKYGQIKESSEASAAAATLARDAAGEAGASAQEASSASAKAVTSSGKALGLASGAKTEADSYKQEIADAKQQAADAVSRLAEAEQRLAESTQREAEAEARLSAIKTPRSLLRTKELVDALTPFSGTVFTLNAFMDDESNRFSVIVAAALKNAGWIRQQPAGINLGIPTMQTVFEAGGKRENVPSCLDTGVAVHITEKESQAELNSKPITSLSLKLRAALALYQVIGPSISPPEEHNVAVGFLDPDPGDESLRICIGKKP